jgi:hypothetical protein
MFETMTISQLIKKLEQKRDLYGEKYVVLSSDVNGSSYGTIDNQRISSSFEVRGNFLGIFPVAENLQLTDIKSEFEDE